jgi:hypothetical protein
MHLEVSKQKEQRRRSRKSNERAIPQEKHHFGESPKSEIFQEK